MNTNINPNERLIGLFMLLFAFFLGAPAGYADAPREKSTLEVTKVSARTTPSRRARLALFMGAKSPQRQLSIPSPKQKITLALARQCYNDGELNRAQRLFLQLGYHEFSRALDQFVPMYIKARHQFRTLYMEEALSILKKALALDFKLGGGKSLFTPYLRKMLAGVFVSRSRLSFNIRSYRSSFLFLCEAKRLSPKLDLQPHFLLLAEQAKKFYQLAMRLRAAGLLDDSREVLLKASRLLAPHAPLQMAIRVWLKKKPS